MTKIILVHGMRATEHSWFQVTQKLKDQFGDVVAPRLPGHEPRDRSVGMKDYLAAIETASQGDDELTLIGHSMGGAVITHFAAQAPDRVKRLIYVAAMLPKAGQSIGGLSMSFGVGPETVKDEFEKAGIVEGDPALGEQPLPPLAVPLPDEPEVATIPKHYVLCKDDQIIPALHQREMISNWDDVEIVELETGHIPQKTALDPLMTALEGFIGA